MTELKPCPFCGGKAEIRTGGNDGFHAPKLVFAQCTKCGAKTANVPISADYAANKEAADVWNQRIREEEA